MREDPQRETEQGDEAEPGERSGGRGDEHEDDEVARSERPLEQDPQGHRRPEQSEPGDGTERKKKHVEHP
ncbi:Uncharacterised protein [Mycobacteroides abscessus subsp. abscessus]|nr:Uncharacterised protein [Mycobacteroides abscessus subsp. abscessus]